VHDEWFADEEKVRRAVGLLERPAVEYPNAREVSSPYFTTVIEFFSTFCLKAGTLTILFILFIIMYA
jgi:hypothetical protein